MLITTIAFAGITVLLAVLHMRQRGSGRNAGMPCPRCKTMVASDASVCPRCNAPMQAYDLVLAPIVADGPEPEASGPLHAVVRSDLCVGCATCVDACPEPGAIVMVSKLATVNLDLCKGHGSCKAACPVGAVVLTAGAAVQRLEVPFVDPHFQTNVRGLYVVGELGGRGLIKNAVNEGKLAVEHIARLLPPSQPRRDHDMHAFDVVVVGAGPAGLSAGLEALKSGLHYLVVEQGAISDTINKYPRKKLLFAEPVRMPLYGDLWVADGSKEELLAVWKTVIAKTGLIVNTGHRVERVERDGEMFRVATADREVRARTVVLAMGRRGTPRRLGVPGEDSEKVLYDIIEMEAFAEQSVLVVGGGDSAVESALGLANQKGTTVSLSYRGTEFSRVKERNQAKLEAAVEQKRVQLLLGTEVREVRPQSVILEKADALYELPNDVVIVRIGGEAPYPFLQRMGVRIVRKEIALEPATHEAAAVS